MGRLSWCLFSVLAYVDTLCCACFTSGITWIVFAGAHFNSRLSGKFCIVLVFNSGLFVTFSVPLLSSSLFGLLFWCLFSIPAYVGILGLCLLLVLAFMRLFSGACFQYGLNLDSVLCLFSVLSSRLSGTLLFALVFRPGLTGLYVLCFLSWSLSGTWILAFLFPVLAYLRTLVL